MVLIFDGQHCECGFVGRTKQLQTADRAWENGKQLFGIYGFKSVGKTRFAKEIILRHWDSGINLCQLDAKGIKSLNEFIIHVTTGVSLVEPTTTASWIHVVCQCLKNRTGDKGVLVVFIENAEDVDTLPEVKSAFLKLCQELVKASTRIKVIFTSSTRFRFGEVNKVSQSIDVPELQPEESKTLLREVVDTEVDLGEYEDKIVELCCGLPLAIQIAGSELTEDGQQLTPKDLVTLLTMSKLDPLSREHYAQEEQMRHVIGGSIDRLSDIFQQYYRSVSYIPGSFTQEAATNILGFDNTAVGIDKAMIPLHRRHLVSFDSSTRRYDINPMQREYLMDNITIRDILGVRTRYAKFFSDCLIRLQKVVDSKDSGKALIPLNLELKNFRKLLEDAALCGKDGTYDVFVRAAMEATFLILYYMPDQSVSFYEVMLDTCREHGSKYETGVLMSIFGEILSEQQGDYLKGLEWYRLAKTKLRPHGNSRRLAEIYQHIGWYYYVHGPGSKAVKNHLKSYMMLLALGLEDDLQTARVMNCLGIAYVAMGNAKEAEQYHTRGLAIRLHHLGEKHLTIAMHYNNIGLMYDLKEDYEKALYYFEKGYQLKKELIGPSKTVIISMRNLGLQYIRKKEYKKALELAEENLATFEQVANRDKNTRVNILEIQSIAYVETGEYALAEPLLREMYEVKRVATPGHSYNRMILKYLGRALRGQGKFVEAGEVLLEAYGMGRAEGPGGFGPLEFEVLQELGKLGIDTCDRVSAKGYFQKAVDERHRWGDYNLKQDKVAVAQDAFQDMMDLVRKVEGGRSAIALSVPKPCCQDDGVCCIKMFGRQPKGFVNETLPKSLNTSTEGSPAPGVWMTENTLPIYVPPKTSGPIFDATKKHQRNPFGETESDKRGVMHPQDQSRMGTVRTFGQNIISSPLDVPSLGSQTIPSNSPSNNPQDQIQNHSSLIRPNLPSAQVVYSPRAHTGTPLPEPSAAFNYVQCPIPGNGFPSYQASTPLPTQTSTDEKAPFLSSGMFGQNLASPASPEGPNAPTPLPKQTSADDDKASTMDSGVFRQNQTNGASSGIHNAQTRLPQQCSAEEKAPTLESLSLSTEASIAKVDSVIIRQHSEAVVSSPEECSLDDGMRRVHGVFGLPSGGAPTQLNAGVNQDTVPKQLHNLGVGEESSESGGPGQQFVVGSTHQPHIHIPQPQYSIPHGQDQHRANQGGHHPLMSEGLRSRSLEERGSMSQQINRPRSMSEGLRTHQQHTLRHHPREEDEEHPRLRFAKSACMQQQQQSLEEGGAMTDVDFLYRQGSLSESLSSDCFEEGEGLLCHPPRTSWHPPSGFPSLSTPSPTTLSPNIGGVGQGQYPARNEQNRSHCVIYME
ncbi:uncharacterized protein LOC135485263 [Lineus longissimus]|uniref:uncharacterized protein LOC135485263 n=1 Tax=Lineus longissimus TaxID=88925 RepID=UPI00315C9956